MNDERSTSDIDKELGRRVRKRRLEIGMSQERLAEILGLTFQQVQKYEKGVNRIAASRLLHISQALKVPIGELYQNMKVTEVLGVAESQSEYVHEGGFDDEQGRLVALFAAIRSAQVRQTVLELVRALAEKDARDRIA